MTRGYGRRCRVPAAAPGLAASTTSSASPGCLKQAKKRLARAAPSLSDRLLFAARPVSAACVALIESPHHRRSASRTHPVGAVCPAFLLLVIGRDYLAGTGFIGSLDEYFACGNRDRK